ncbi:MAG TPA: HigA family addiction module antitoxin [Terracidiphilus sp.]|nr:HigA family addiction module antitoxin [Terracidiphilus sp.]
MSKIGASIDRRTPIPRDAKNRMPPLHPGEMLREEFLIPLGMTGAMLAKEMKVPARRVLAIVKEQQSLDGDMVLRLARYFRMSPEFWMGIAKNYELEAALQDWPKICKEVAQHPKDRKTGALRIPKNMREGRTA